MIGLVSLVGLALMHIVGALLRALVGRRPVKSTLRSASSAWFAIAALYAASFGVLGVALAVPFALAVSTPPPVAPRRGLLVSCAIVVALVLAQPWVPTFWDELVWLGKARLESLGLFSGLRASLDPSQDVLPAGYPSLWPATTGWLSLGVDALYAHVTAASLLVALCVASALEAWWAELSSKKVWAVVAVLATPFIWVHLQSTYVDLPLGALGLALLGTLLAGDIALGAAIAIAMVGFKDEGAAHVLAATVGAFAARRTWETSVPLLAGALALVMWRLFLNQHGIVAADHSLSTPLWPWVPALAKHLVLHATDVFTWGLFWALMVIAVAFARAEPTHRLLAVRVTLLVNVVISCGALLSGTERVRVFAENGTLLNRLLLQWWPTAAVLVLFYLTKPSPEAPR